MNKILSGFLIFSILSIPAFAKERMEPVKNKNVVILTGEYGEEVGLAGTVCQNGLLFSFILPNKGSGNIIQVYKPSSNGGSPQPKKCKNKH